MVLFFGQQQVDGEAAEQEKRSQTNHERSGDLSDAGEWSQNGAKPGGDLIVLPSSQRDHRHKQDQQRYAFRNHNGPGHAFDG